MKVLVIRKIKNVAGGIDRSLVKAIPELRDQDIEIAFLSANDGYIIPEMRELGIEVFLPEEDLSGLDHRWERFVLQSIEKYKPDLLYLKQLDIIVSVASLRIGIPLVGAIHSSLFEWASEEELRDLQTALSRLSGIHAVGYRIEQELRRLGARNVTQIFSPVERSSLTSSARYTPRDPRLLFVGRADTRKGLDVLVRALPEVCSEFPKMRLAVIGQTGEETRERGGGTDRPLAKEIGVDGMIDWLGIQSHDSVLEYMSRSDLLVSASRYEGVPGVILEAHSLALPVVATTASAEAMLWGDAGLIVPRDNAFLLSQAIVSDLRDPQRIARAAENRRVVCKQRSAKNLVGNIKSSFQEALETQADYR